MEVYKKRYMIQGRPKVLEFNYLLNDIMKIIETLESSGILLKGVSKTIETETK